MGCIRYYNGKAYTDEQLEDLYRDLENDFHSSNIEKIVYRIQSSHGDDYANTDAQALITPEFKHNILVKGLGEDYGVGAITKFVHYSLENNGRPENLKLSAAELSDDLLNNNPDMQNVRNNIDRINSKRKEQGLVPIGVVAFNTTVKIAGLSDDLMVNGEDLIKEGFEIPSTSIVEHKTSGIRVPFNPAHTTDSHAKSPSQLLFFMNVLGTNTKEADLVYSKLAEIYKDRREVYESTLYKDEVAEDGTVKRVINMEATKEFVRKTLSSETNADILEIFNTAISSNPLDIPAISDQIIINMAAVMDTNVRVIEHKGGAAVLQSIYGSKRSALLAMLSPEHKALLDGKGLSIVTKVDAISGKRTMNMECLLPSGFLPKDVEDQMKYAIENGDELPDLLPYSDVLGFRIPSTELHSAVALKAVGFYDSKGSNIIITAQQLVNLHGSDFDVDKLFVITREVNKDYIHSPYSLDGKPSDLSMVNKSKDAIKNAKKALEELLESDADIDTLNKEYTRLNNIIQTNKNTIEVYNNKAKLNGTYMERMVGYEEVFDNRVSTVEDKKITKLRQDIEDSNESIKDILVEIADLKQIIEDQELAHEISKALYKTLKEDNYNALKNYKDSKASDDTKALIDSYKVKFNETKNQLNDFKIKYPEYVKAIEDLKVTNDDLKAEKSLIAGIRHQIKIYSIANKYNNTKESAKHFVFDPTMDTSKMSSEDKEKYNKNYILETVLSVITAEKNFERMNKAIVFDNLKESLTKIAAYKQGLNALVDAKLSDINNINFEDFKDLIEYPDELSIQMAKDIVKSTNEKAIKGILNFKEDLDLSDPMDDRKASNLVNEGLSGVGIGANFLKVISYLARAGEGKKMPTLNGSIYTIEDILSDKSKGDYDAITSLEIGDSYSTNLNLTLDGTYKIGKDYYKIVSSEEDPIDHLSVQVKSYKGYFTRELLIENPDNVYLFGDNTDDRVFTKHIPSKTQAVIRGLDNAIGIDTKKNRGTKDDSYFTNADFDTFKVQVDSAIKDAISSNKTIIIPSEGIGTGKADLKNKAPKLFNYLQERLDKLLASSRSETVNEKKVKYVKELINGIELTEEAILKLFNTTPNLNAIVESIGGEVFLESLNKGNLLWELYKSNMQLTTSNEEESTNTDDIGEDAETFSAFDELFDGEDSKFSIIKRFSSITKVEPTDNIGDISSFGSLFKIDGINYNKFSEKELTGDFRDIYTFIDGTTNASLDNVKEQLLPNLNMTEFLLPMSNLFIAMGGNQDVLLNMLQQPALMYMSESMSTVKKSDKLGTLLSIIEEKLGSIPKDTDFNINSKLLYKYINKKFSIEYNNELDVNTYNEFLLEQYKCIKAFKALESLGNQINPLVKVLSLLKDSPVKMEDMDAITHAIRTVFNTKTWTVKKDFPLNITNFLDGLPHIKQLVQHSMWFNGYLNTLFTKHSPIFRRFVNSFNMAIDTDPITNEAIKRTLLMKYLVSSIFNVSKEKYTKTTNSDKIIPTKTTYYREEAFVKKFVDTMAVLKNKTDSIEFSTMFPKVDPIFLKYLTFSGDDIAGVMDQITPIEIEECKESFKTLNYLNVTNDESTNYTPKFHYNPDTHEGSYSSLQYDFMKYIAIRYGGSSKGTAFTRLIDPKIYNNIFNDGTGKSFNDKITAKLEGADKEYLEMLKNDIELNIRLGELKATRMASKVPSIETPGKVDVTSGNQTGKVSFDIAYLKLTTKQNSYIGNYITREIKERNNEGDMVTKNILYKLVHVIEPETNDSGDIVGNEVYDKYYKSVGEIKSSRYFRTLHDSELLGTVSGVINYNNSKISLRNYMNTNKTTPVFELSTSPSIKSQILSNGNYITDQTQNDVIIVKQAEDIVNASAELYTLLTVKENISTYKKMNEQEIADFYKKLCA